METFLIKFMTFFISFFLCFYLLNGGFLSNDRNFGLAHCVIYQYEQQTNVNMLKSKAQYYIFMNIW